MSAPNKPSLLIVDDDPLITDTLSYVLGRDFDVSVAGSRSECVAALRGRAAPPDLALVDLGLPPQPHRPDEGLALIGDLLAHAPGVRIVVLSGQSDEAHARHARALGAVEFVAKPADAESLSRTLTRVLGYPLAATAASPPTEEDPCGLVGRSPLMQAMRSQVRQYANSPFPVLIEGESGSGKEIIASCHLHRLTPRTDRPYLALNCAAISPSLVEPTLFGYAKGAFTGAIQAKSGYFEDAADGTLFLDEIGELPLDLQPKLLRVLENGEYQRVGETQARASQARVIAATNRDLRKEVREGRFRADLYHRLSVFTVSVPPLREMGEDKRLLLDHFSRMFARQGGHPPFRLDDAAQARWLAYPFPGNVRELRNIVIRLTAKFPGAPVSAAALEEELDSDETAPQGAWLPPRDAGELSEIALRHLQQRGQFDLDATLRGWEQGYIQAALKLTHGNVSQAARLLGVNRTTLYNRMDALDRQVGE